MLVLHPDGASTAFRREEPPDSARWEHVPRPAALADHREFAFVTQLAQEPSRLQWVHLAQFGCLTARDRAMPLDERSYHLSLLDFVEPLGAHISRRFAKLTIDRGRHVIGTPLALTAGFQQAALHRTQGSDVPDRTDARSSG